LRCASRLGGVLIDAALPLIGALLFAHDGCHVTNGAHPKLCTGLLISCIFYNDASCSTGANQGTCSLSCCIWDDDIIAVPDSAKYDALAGWYVVMYHDLCSCDNVFVLIGFGVISHGYRPERLKHRVGPFVANSASASNYVHSTFGSNQLCTIQNRRLVV
jgi:hypothetical protein